MSDKDKNVETLETQIGQLSTKLDEIRDDLDKSVDSRVDSSLKKRGFGEAKEIEERVATDLAGTFLKLDEAQKIVDRLDKVEAIRERIISDKVEGRETPEVKMYELFLENAFTGIVPDELRAFMGTPEHRTLVETVDPSGGFFVPEVISSEIIKDWTEISDVRSIARVSQTDGKQFSIIRRTTIPTASRVSETGSGSESEPKWKKVTIPVTPMIAKTPISDDLLEDSIINLRAELQADAAIAFAYLEGTEFVNGTAVNEPEGFMTNADVGEKAGIETVANKVEGDDFYNLQGEIATPYRRNGRYVMNTATWIYVMTLKDSNGAYIWQSGLQQGAPPTIAGKPYTILDDMPDQANGAYPVCFGDFMIGYRIVDRAGMTLQFENVTNWPNYWAKYRMRNGGGVTQPNALVKLKL